MRRTLLITLLLSLSGLSPSSAQQHSPRGDEALAHARKLLRAFPLIDGHNDLPWSIRIYKAAARDVEAYDLRKRTSGDTDLGRLREGEVGGQFWSVYIPGGIKEGKARIQLEQIDIARRMIARYPEAFALALSAADVEHAFKKGLIASLIGMEGGHAIENSLGALRAFYLLGVRYMTLTHNVTIDWADAALDSAKHNGLTAFGREVVREMNRLGMLVDLSHVSPRVMSNVLDVSEAPVIFSHSSARALTDHPRNVPDSILSRMRKNGGVVMTTFVPEFVSQQVLDWDDTIKVMMTGATSDATEDSIHREFAARHPRPKATVIQVADHIEHIRNVAGVDHVGIGSDFYGGEDMPVGLEDVSRFPYLFAELVRRGWSDSDLAKLAGRNILRVLRENEAVARRLQSQRPASVATIEELDGTKK